MRNCFQSLPAGFALGALLLLPLHTHTHAQSENWYRVEVMIFSYPSGGAAEHWEPTPKLAYPEATRFLILPGEQQPATTSPAGAASSAAAATSGVGISVPTPALLTPLTTLPIPQREFSIKADTMRRTGRYRILFHEAWMQPMSSQSGTLPIVLDRSGDGGSWPELQGSISVYQSGDLYLATNFWQNTQGEYLHSAWQMPPPPLGPASTAGVAAALVAQPGQKEADRQVATDGFSQGVSYPFKHAVLLQQTRRMRSGEVHYIDHPMLGLVAKITALNEADSSITDAAETAASEPSAPNVETSP